MTNTRVKVWHGHTYGRLPQLIVAATSQKRARELLAEAHNPGWSAQGFRDYWSGPSGNAVALSVAKEEGVWKCDKQHAANPGDWEKIR
jgi:hypothetical protein